MINNDNLLNAYDVESFKDMGHRIVDGLAEYLEAAKGRGLPKVLPDIGPDKMLEKWPGRFTEEGRENMEALFKQVVAQSNHLHHPRYVGHQVTAPLPMAALMDFVSQFLNNGAAIYEMGPVNVVMEKRVIDWIAGLAGHDKEAGGIFTSGGTLGNLTALLAARQEKAGYDIWSEGVKPDPSLAIMVSGQCHYSVRRAAGVMGIGDQNVITVPVNDKFKMELKSIKAKYREAKKKGLKVFALVGNGCSTATGTYDQLDMLGKFCQQNDIWLHVDGAHGASALLSDKYKHLLQGLHMADSWVWDTHKMLLMPALTTGVIFKQAESSYESFSQKANYLFERSAREEWFNYAHRTMECTKKMMGLKIYICLAHYGTQLFSDYITRMYDLTMDFADLIHQSEDFECANIPESNIICFRHLPLKKGEGELNSHQLKLRRRILETEKFYVVQAQLNGTQYLRCCIINPMTTFADLQELLDFIRELKI